MLPLTVERFPLPPGFSRQMFDDAKIGPRVRPLSEDVIGDIGQMLWILLGTVGLVLLIACANVANLFLVRAEGRQQELAIHAALGASWRRDHLGAAVGESLTLAAAGRRGRSRPRLRRHPRARRDRTRRPAARPGDHARSGQSCSSPS